MSVTSKIFVTFKGLMVKINSIRKTFDHSYVLWHYVPKDFWVEKIKKHFGVREVENLTDFNYDRCFRILINIDGSATRLLDQEFNEIVIRKGEYHRLEMLISVVGPFAIYRFLRYYPENGAVKLEYVEKPLKLQQRKFGQRARDFCQKNDLQIVSENIQQKRVPGLKLELAGKNPTIHQVFFSDG